MTTQYMKQNNGLIAYEVAGEGPLVVCVPSLGDVRGQFRFLAPQLITAGYRVAVMDVRGHGESSTAWDDFSVAGIGADILALIRELEGGSAVVIGSSMASGAAVWAAAEAPEQVSGLLLIDPFVDGDSNRFQVFLLSLLFARPWGPAMWKKYYSALYPTRKPADFTEYVEKLSANLAQPGRLEAMMAMVAASKQASSELLSKVTQPTLVVMGSKDPDFKNPAAEARRVARLLSCDYKIIPDAGHYPQAEMPDVIGPVSIDFLNSIQKG